MKRMGGRLLLAGPAATASYSNYCTLRVVPVEKRAVEASQV
jgi:hypothetical protein